MATPSTDTIRKKMQAMIDCKENAYVRADQAERKKKEFEEKIKLVELKFFLILKYNIRCKLLKQDEEHSSLLKRISQLDLELDKAEEELSEVNTKLDVSNKNSAEVSDFFFVWCSRLSLLLFFNKFKLT
jgi:hypothetical protein